MKKVIGATWIEVNIVLIDFNFIHAIRKEQMQKGLQFFREIR